MAGDSPDKQQKAKPGGEGASALDWARISAAYSRRCLPGSHRPEGIRALDWFVQVEAEMASELGLSVKAFKTALDAHHAQADREYRAHLAGIDWHQVAREIRSVVPNTPTLLGWASTPMGADLAERFDLRHEDFIDGVRRYEAKHGTKRKLAAAPTIIAEPAIEITPEDIGYLHATMVQCFFNGTQPEITDREHSANFGKAVLKVRAGELPDVDAEGEFVQRSLPWGSAPRILVPYINREILLTSSCIVDMGANLERFLRGLGIALNTDSRNRFTNAVYDLAASEITLSEWKGDEVRHRRSPVSQDTRIRRKPARPVLVDTNFWVEKDYRQGLLWQPTIEVTPQYKQAVTSRNPVPVPFPVLVQLQKSWRAMDILEFLAYKCPLVPDNGKPSVTYWSLLQKLFGDTLQGKENLPKFKQAFQRALRKAVHFYPAARVHLDQKRGLFLHRSPHLIKPEDAFRQLRDLAK